MNIFGTDGIRGRANTGYITPENVMKLAISAFEYFSQKTAYHNNSHFTVVIGKDTRLSGYMLESSLTAGFIAAGVDVRLLGPVPTPTVAIMTKTLKADLGVVISASHNPYTDNGVKFFNKNGLKLTYDDEIGISKIFQKNNLQLAETNKIGKAVRVDDINGRYIEFVKNSFLKNLNLSGKKIVIDAANGAAYKVAHSIFWELGAEVHVINDMPNGCNINENCGAIFPKTLCKAVVDLNADIGFALDGDADRIVVVDEKGCIVDGDHVIATIATDWHQRNKLRNNKVVVTTMSNSALDDYLQKLEIETIRSDVGDKHVVNDMINNHCNLGGEKSGHIIALDYSTTGDGLIAAIQILNYMLRCSIKSSNLHSCFDLYPQTCINIPKIVSKDSEKIDKLKHDLLQKKLIKRIVVRKSGTENVTRIMLESFSEQNLEQAKNIVISVLTK